MAKVKEFLKTDGGKVTLTIVTYVIYLLIVGLLSKLGLGTSDNKVMIVIAAVLSIASLYFGWRTLSFIQPNVFLIMPLVGWLFYFVIKGILSIFIGVFVIPYQISKLILNAVR